MKKIVVLSSLFFSFVYHPALAWQFYVGGAAGLGMLDGHYQANLASNNDKHEATIGGTSGLAGGVVGVETGPSPSFYSALELNGLYDSYNKTVRNSTNTAGVTNHAVKVKNNFLYGAIVKLGTCFSGSFPYLLAGVEAGKWTMTLSNNTGISNRGIPPNSSVNVSKTLYGPKVGAGIKLQFLPCLSGDFQYAYTWFGTVSRQLLDPITGSWSHKSKINQGTVLFGLNYSFQ